MKRLNSKAIIKSCLGMILLVIILVVLLMQTSNAMVKTTQSMDKDVLHQNKAYIMQIEEINTNQIKLYDKRNEIEITLDWYYENDEMKQLRESIYYYNYSTDELFRIYKGELFDMQDEGL